MLLEDIKKKVFHLINGVLHLSKKNLMGYCNRTFLDFIAGNAGHSSETMHCLQFCNGLQKNIHNGLAID